MPHDQTTRETIKARATHAQILALQPGEKERLVSDDSVSRLFLVISPKGKKGWRWLAPKCRKVGIGEYPYVTRSEARVKAEECNAMRARGLDPATEFERLEAERVEAEKAAARVKVEAVSNTVRKVFERFIATKSALRTVEGKRRLMANLLDPHGDKPIGELTRADVRGVLQTIKARGSIVSANRTLAEIKPFLDWCCEEELVETNVASAIRKDSTAEGLTARRNLTLSELGYLYRAAEKFESKEVRDFIRLMILTGCRRSEAAGARLSEWDSGDKIWRIPRGRAKTKVTYVLPLAPLGAAIFDSRVDSARDTILHKSPHPDAYKKELVAFRDMVDSVAGRPVVDWDRHSIRHGIRTEIVERGCCDPIIAEKIINHSTGRYDHGEYRSQKLDALTKWEKVLMDEIKRQTGDNVVSLRA